MNITSEPQELWDNCTTACGVFNPYVPGSFEVYYEKHQKIQAHGIFKILCFLTLATSLKKC